MWVVAFLTVGLLAWIGFIYTQYHYGDRPTNVVWYAVMMTLGVFEYGKGVLGLIELGVSPLPVAGVLAMLTGACVYYFQARKEAGERVAHASHSGFVVRGA
jgi:hypothetical protein